MNSYFPTFGLNHVLETQYYLQQKMRFQNTIQQCINSLMAKDSHSVDEI